MDIVDEIKNDPEAGAARLEREYASKLLFVAKNVCSDENEAKGLVYDTMAEAVRQVGKLSKPKSFFSWMCSILVRKHGASKRRKSEENVTFTDDLPGDSFELYSEESLYAAVDGALLRDAVAELPEKLREAVILRYFMDMP
ncbi:MAG: sigma-70 family RNA polymerase sigma factor, partial [Kiritimatiellae bacterium]|nr:sigma-70 family RNA polymerase sigma factor [Kiritimatiellia bacterium]